MVKYKFWILTLLASLSCFSAPFEACSHDAGDN